jgi:hypothetical protein
MPRGLFFGGKKRPFLIGFGIKILRNGLNLKVEFFKDFEISSILFKLIASIV